MKGAWQLGASALALAGVLAIGACGGSSSSGPKSNTTITQGEAAAIGQAASQQLGDFTASLASFRVSDPTGGAVPTAAVPNRFRAASRLLLAMTNMAPPDKRGAVMKLFGGTSGDCTPTITGDTTDTNGNGIPANATYTYTATNCSTTVTDTVLGAISIQKFAATGSIHAQDLGSSTVLFGYDVGFSNLTWTEYDSSAQATVSYSFGISGSNNANVQSSTGSTGANYVFSYSLDGSKLFQYNVNSSVGFTPAVGQVIDTASGTLPAGDFDVSGSFSWNSSAGGSGADGNWSFSLGTTNALSYDGSCTSSPPFDGGTVQVAITGVANVGFTMIYSGCGVAPTVTAYTS